MEDAMSLPLPNTGKALAFYSITLTLAVLVRLAVPWIGDASLPVTMLTPAVAVAIMLGTIAPEDGAMGLLGLNRTGRKAWPLAIGGPFLIHAIGLVVLATAGLTAISWKQVNAGAGPDILIGFLVGTGFALGEEVGWRGYMLPRLTSIGVVGAMLLVGFLHGIWHLPILLTTDFYHNTGNPWLVVPLFLVTLTLAGVFYGFLRLWTNSVWPVAIAHAAANQAWDLSSRISEIKSAVVFEYVGGESGAIMIVGLAIICLLIIRFMRQHAMVERR
jgi:uncharacterized protein